MMTTPELQPPIRCLEYHDFTVGETIPFGRKKVTEADIVRYARAFDPQPFHLSEETARDSNVGRLIASGYHTCCIMMRMLADDLIGGANALGSPGLDEVRFLKPVFPGDELTARCHVIEKRELKSKPGVGLVHGTLEMTNQRGEVVMTWDMKAFRRIVSPTNVGGAA
jgi:acyl dehydratase